jgi:hypothetical protein
VTITQSPVPGSAVTLETPVTVTVTARDAAGNLSTTCSFTVVVFDGPPALRVPGALTLNADSTCSAAVPNLLTNSATVATDNCSGVTLVQSPEAGTLLGLGVTNAPSAPQTPSNTVSGTVRITVVTERRPRSLPSRHTSTQPIRTESSRHFQRQRLICAVQ